MKFKVTIAPIFHLAQKGRKGSIYYRNKKDNGMTELLEKAIAELKKLPDRQQKENNKQ
jgi:hypothetical protein